MSIDLGMYPRHAIGPVEINGRPIGPGHPTYIVAEMSSNHGQDLDRAMRLVRAAKRCGADAIKLQTFTPDTMTLDSALPDFWVPPSSLWGRRTLYELYQAAYMPWEWQVKLKEEADRIGITLFSTPSDLSSVDFLEKLGVPAYKIASFENRDYTLLTRVAQTGKPIILSTGLSDSGDIYRVLDLLGKLLGKGRTPGPGNGTRPVPNLVLLKCTSSYPAPARDMNLNAIPAMMSSFHCPVGLSDHTHGRAVPVSAVALGACMIEKHFTLSKEDRTLDSAFSLSSSEFSLMVRDIRTVEEALGSPILGSTMSELRNRCFQRSLYVVKDIAEGELLTPDNVRPIRPGYGMDPRQLPLVLGRRAKAWVGEGTALSWDLIAPPDRKP